MVLVGVGESDALPRVTIRYPKTRNPPRTADRITVEGDHAASAVITDRVMNGIVGSTSR